MSDEPKKRAWSTGSMTIGLVALGYLLSIGPAVRYAPNAALSIYNPLVRVCDGCPPLSALKDSYTSLWGAWYRSTVNPGIPQPVTCYCRTVKLSR